MIRGPARLWRLPIESQKPLMVFAGARLALTLLSVPFIVLLDFSGSGRLAAVLASVALPWSLLNIGLARWAPGLAMSALVAVGDLLVLVAVQAVSPETFAAVRFMALAFLAVHAHFQGERLGLALVAVSVPLLIVASAITDGTPVAGRLLVLYEVYFAAAAVVAVGLVGGFRTAESASRLRARELMRRAMRSEADVRRQVAEGLHDGPVQALIGLDMVLVAARREAASEGAERTRALLEELQILTERNIVVLRDEISVLGPHGLDRLSYEAALQRCMPIWKRRYGLQTTLQIDTSRLPAEAEGDLFRITQEAVVNAAKHGHADNVSITLACAGDRIELEISDDGGGFDELEPLESTEPGHIGLGGIRERAELLDGTLRIDSSPTGVTVKVVAPVRASRGRWR